MVKSLYGVLCWLDPNFPIQKYFLEVLWKTSLFLSGQRFSGYLTVYKLGHVEKCCITRVLCARELIHFFLHLDRMCRYCFPFLGIFGSCCIQWMRFLVYVGCTCRIVMVSQPAPFCLPYYWKGDWCTFENMQMLAWFMRLKRKKKDFEYFRSLGFTEISRSCAVIYSLLII